MGSALPSLSIKKLEDPPARGYIKSMNRFFVLIAILAGVFWITLSTVQGLSAQRMGGLVKFSQETLMIRSGGITHKFTVELALNSRQHAQGLMFRQRMAPDAGMLFVYRREEPTAMWMKNTLIPLDMLFIKRDGTIRRIAERTVPMSEAIIGSGGPVVAVLELNAGTASRLGLKPGGKVASSSLGTTQ